MMRTHSKKQAGFTLIEVMVAMLILGIAMTSIHYGQAQGIRAQARIQNVTLATIMAKELKVKLLNGLMDIELPRAGESVDGFFEPPYDFLHWQLRAEEHESVPDFLSNYYLTISWPDTSGKNSSKGNAPSAEESAGKRLEICWLRLNL